MKRRFFILTATAAVLLLLTALTAFAAPASGECGENLRWALDDNGVLTVSGSGDMTDYAVDGTDASPFAALGFEIKSVEIGDGVTSVGNNAFYQCYGVKRISLPEGLTRIGDGAFYYCREVTELALPETVTEIGLRAFRSCLALENITLPEGVVRVGDKAFDDTAWYKSQPDGPVYLNHVLLNYKGEMHRKAEIEIEAGTRVIADSALWACGRMISLTLPEGLLHIGNEAFYECDGFSELTLPEGLLTIGERSFYCCNGVKTVSLPHSLTTIGKSAFAGCRSLTRIFVPAGVTEIGTGAIPDKVIVEGYEGTYAQRFAEQMGLPFELRRDEFAPETTTAPEGQRAIARRRKEIGTVVICAVAGAIGVAAAVGLVIIRGRQGDEEEEEEIES